jgi:hypothetical protein
MRGSAVVDFFSRQAFPALCVQVQRRIGSRAGGSSKWRLAADRADMVPTRTICRRVGQTYSNFVFWFQQLSGRGSRI